MRDLLSIIIPVYNSSEYISHCWEGLSGQTYPNIEYIFIDDCSQDNTKDQLISFQKADNRIKIFTTNENSGASIARNIGIAKANGKYIGFCDADDYCKPYMFEEMINCLEKNDADISCCAMERLDENGTVFKRLWESKKEIVMSGHQALRNWLIGKYIGSSIDTKVFRKELWDGVSFPKGKYMEECCVIASLLLKAKKVTHTGNDGYQYYNHPNSITTQVFNEDRLVVYERERNLADIINQELPDAKNELGAFIVKQNMAMMYKAITARRLHQIDFTIYKTIKKEFQKTGIFALRNPFLSIKDKIKIIELLSGLAFFRVKG